jgi:alpha-1,3-glucosyltransferase
VATFWYPYPSLETTPCSKRTRHAMSVARRRNAGGEARGEGEARTPPFSARAIGAEPEPENAQEDTTTSLVSPLKLYMASVVLKILLVYSYASTDLDVHTNWMAVTHSRPVKDWYADRAGASEWTLDYPPLFAWLEFGLAKVANAFPILQPFLDEDSKASRECGRHVACLLYQRLTVIASEFVLFAGVVFATMRGPGSRQQLQRHQALAVFLVLFHPALLIVDHIHFQYNGFLLGLLLISMTLAASGNDILATVAFSMLLCFKHIYLYVAPAFGCYYLGVLFNSPMTGLLRRLRFLLGLAGAALSVLVVAFGPLYYHGMLGQIVRRLFPLERGLIHAYWAPNFWALYAAVEKVLSFSIARDGLGDEQGSVAAFTGGVVQATPFRVLPQVTSDTTVVVTLVAMLPALVRLLRRPLPGQLWHAVVYCSLCSFMFGYHVHEKAILMTLIPMAVGIVLLDKGKGRPRGNHRYLFLSVVGTYSLFPLLPGVEAYLVKVGALVGYAVITWLLIGDDAARSWHSRRRLELTFATAGIVAVETYASFLHVRVFGEAWPFVPLMLVSCYCAVGVTWTWWSLASDQLRFYS